MLLVFAKIHQPKKQVHPDSEFKIPELVFDLSLMLSDLFIYVGGANNY